jgi:hypothetical protein
MTGRLSSVVFDCRDPHRLALPSTEPGFRVYADPAGHPFCLEWG